MDLNLSITYNRSQGKRKYMEDYTCITYNSGSRCGGFDFLCIGIFDGHGGREAAAFCNNALAGNIINCKEFWSDEDEDVFEAIRKGFALTHFSMWGKSSDWPKTPTGHPSTSGTTATMVFFRKGKVYYGHVGDSTLVLGYEKAGRNSTWYAKPLTIDHKPEIKTELQRIKNGGGKVAMKAGVARVVWFRPDTAHEGPILRSTYLEEVPFLAIGRSLGDFWSYNTRSNAFNVSPEPDVGVITINESHKCLVLATDGLWNVVKPSAVINIVKSAHQWNTVKSTAFCEEKTRKGKQVPWINPSLKLMREASRHWNLNDGISDNITILTIEFQPPGPFTIEPKHSGQLVNVVVRGADNKNYPKKKLYLATQKKIGSFRTFSCTTRQQHFAMLDHSESDLEFEIPECGGFDYKRDGKYNGSSCCNHGHCFFCSPCTSKPRSPNGSSPTNGVCHPINSIEDSYKDDEEASTSNDKLCDADQDPLDAIMKELNIFTQVEDRKSTSVK